MKNLRQRLVGWLEQRTGLESAVKNFLCEDIPASAGWPQVFGSVALFLFLVQVFTGLLLSFNYAPTPGDAYNSVKYIMTEVTGGRLVRGLHHWGASMMIVVVAIHMAQVFLFGAYKKPREATWMIGVILLLLVLGFGLTGYLLPWDNRAYWGTVVTTQIASKAPFAGPYLLRLLGSDGSVGVLTFSRFYSLHVMLLPLLTTLLIGLHVYLVRKHGVTPSPGDSAPPKKFYPEQVFKETVAVFIAFIMLFVLAVAVQAPLERLADPTDTSYIPRPEWYFLFLFQMLKFFEGPLETFGSVVLPNLAILVLLLVPFIDRTMAKRWRERTVAFGALALATLGWTGLTAAAILTTPPSSTVAESHLGGPEDWPQLSPEELAGVGYFRRENCSTCHNLGSGPSKIGPDLGTTAVRKSAAWMIEHFRRPDQLMPGTAMPPTQLSRPQLNALAAFLLRLTPANARALGSAPDWAVQGALLYQAHQCGTCHIVNDVGMKVGPVLNGLSRRRDREWVEKHFREPQSLSPGTIMPDYEFSPREMDRMVRYLFSLPDR
jgi:ubiquinol-cytochrome c reductase cytochrome b subunit